MAQPAAAGMAAASAAPSAIPATSTSSTAAPDNSRTPLYPRMSITSSTFEQNPHNVAALPAQLPPVSTESSDNYTDSTTGLNSIETTGHSSAAASAIDQAHQTQDEARKLQFALAQQQVQQYQAMTKQLEAQSGIVMTPSSTKNSINTTFTSVAGLAKTSEELQKRRQEQLAKLQQNVQRQAARAAQAVQKRSNEEWLRSKLLLEQEHLRLLRLHDQQLQQNNRGNTVSTATATSIADTLLAQQQQVIRQQQLLRDMLQKQQNQHKVQAQLNLRLQNGGNDQTHSLSTPSVPSTVKMAYPTPTPTYYSVKKRKLKSAFETDLESLAKVCIRVANARTDCEMRQALEKMTSWLHRCTELMLLQIAERDYRDSMAHRRPMLIQQNRWPMDLHVKSEFITQKIVRMLEAFVLREERKAIQQEAAAKAAVAVSAAVATAAASGTISLPSVQNQPAMNAAAASSTAPAVPSPSSTVLAPAVRGPVRRNVLAVEREYAELKAQLQARQIEMNQKAKAKRDAAKLEAFKAADNVTTAVTLERPLQLVVPDSVKKAQTESLGTPSPAFASMYRPATTTVSPISPRVAQQFYDLDLVTRASTEGDDKMYLPSKSVSKIMYRALQNDHDVTVATNATGPFSAHSVQEHERSHDSIYISEDAVTFMQECVTEFLLYFTSEARDLSVLQNRRTKKGMGLSISGANVVEGMDNLGLTSYARVLSGFNEKVKACQDAVARKKMERKKLIQQQAAAKAATAVSSMSIANGGAKLGAMLSESKGNGVRSTSESLNSTITRTTSAASNTAITLAGHKPTNSTAESLVASSTVTRD